MLNTIADDRDSLTNVIDVVVNYLLLQIRIANVGMGMVDQVKRFDTIAHHNCTSFFINNRVFPCAPTS